MQIRRAVEADFSEILPLLEELLERPTDNIEEARGIFTKSLQSSKRTILVAVEDGRVEGLITLTVYFKEAFYTRCFKAEIDEFIVSANVRGTGVAGLLMEQALQFASERGCKFVELWTRLDNERAHAFYQKYGFVKKGLFLQNAL